MKLTIMFGKILIILSLLYISSVTSQNIPNYDELILAEQWKRSSCCSVNRLSSPLPNCDKCEFTDSASDWTIHGLWPSDSTRKNSVEFCPNPATSINFNNYPANLLAEMNKYWPNNQHNANNNGFWWREWRKHGTCAIELPETANHMSYFSKTIDLYNHNQVGSMLERGGIVPQKGYTIDDIYNALENNMQNHKPTVRCIKNGGISYLSEVYMCFTKQFTLKNCIARSNCAKDVYYP